MGNIWIVTPDAADVRHRHTQPPPKPKPKSKSKPTSGIRYVLYDSMVHYQQIADSITKEYRVQMQDKSRNPFATRHVFELVMTPLISAYGLVAEDKHRRVLAVQFVEFLDNDPETVTLLNHYNLVAPTAPYREQLSTELIGELLRSHAWSDKCKKYYVSNETLTISPDLRYLLTTYYFFQTNHLPSGQEFGLKLVAKDMDKNIVVRTSA